MDTKAEELKQDLQMFGAAIELQRDLLQALVDLHPEVWEKVKIPEPLKDHYRQLGIQV